MRYIPVIEQSNRSVGALPEYWLIIPWLCARGAGMLSVIALWNLRRLGSTVTIGETATPRPNSLAVKSGSIGWAYICFFFFILFSRTFWLELTFRSNRKKNNYQFSHQRNLLAKFFCDKMWKIGLWCVVAASSYINIW